jgi:hypothetical protein
MKRCVICGARARGATCGLVCTHARKAGVSREEQIRSEMDSRDWSVREAVMRRNGHWMAPATWSGQAC